MDYLEKQTRGLLIGCLKAVGFSVGEAESRVESLKNEKELEYLIQYIHEHRGASIDEIRFVHTGMVRKRDAKLIGTKNQKTRVTDHKAEKDGLLIREAQIDWDTAELNNYLKDINALRGLKSIEFQKPITFFVGENGCGKSTLLEALAIASGYNPEGGTRNYDFSTRDTHSELCKAICLEKGTRRPAWGIFLRAETFYNMATAAEMLDEDDDNSGAMFNRYGGSSFHKMSHGESFYTMLETDITDNGLYFLDEPEAALSPRRQLNLLGLLHKYADRGAQFIIATHSPILLACPNASIYEFSDYGVKEIGYEETDIYKIVSGFVKNRDQMLKEVIIDERQF